jgi:hypothetical protein
MTPPTRSNKALTTALWANAALLALIVIFLFNRNGAPSILPAAYGQNQPAIGGGAGVFIVPAQMQTNVFGCYLLDVDAKTISAYEFFPGEHMLRWAASRSYRYDTKIDNYNTAIPPNEVKSMLDKQAAGKNGAGAPLNEKDKDK